MFNSILLCVLWLAMRTSVAATFPDIVFKNEMGFSGYGRLTFSESKNRYELVNGRINTYVYSLRRVRMMNPDEGGGTMANPGKVLPFNGSIFGTNAYNQLVKFDSQTGQIVDSFNFGEDQYSGEALAPLFVTSKALVLFKNSEFVTLGSDLKEISSLKLNQEKNHIRRGSQFVQMGDHLYTLKVENPASHIECAGVCKVPITIHQTKIDLSQPTQIKIDKKEEKLESSFYFYKQALLKEGWILVRNDPNQKSYILEFRSFSELSKPKFQSDLLGKIGKVQILGMTNVDPIWMVLQSKKKFELVNVMLKSDKIDLKRYKIDWIDGYVSGFNLKVFNSKLFITAESDLAIYDLKGDMTKPIFKQSFVGSNGSALFHFSDFELGTLAQISTPIDRDRVQSILKKDFWSNSDQLFLESEIEKLSQRDKWALPLFIDAVKNRRSWYNGGMIYSMRALEKFGTEAAEILPFLLKENLGSSYQQPQKDLAFSLIKKIDPTAEGTISKIQPNLEDSFKVRSTVELLEYIGSPKALELARKTRQRWKLQK